MKSQSVIKDQFRVIVAKDIARTATVGSLASPSSLQEGEVVVTDAGNVILDTTTVLLTDRIKLVQGRGSANPLFETATFTGAELYQYKGQAYEAPQQQVTYVGYDAVAGSGSFEVLNNNAYAMTLTFISDVTVPGIQGNYIPVTTWYQSDASATQAEVCNGLYALQVAQLAKFPYPVILSERVNSDVGAGTGQTATVTKGSKTVTLTGTTSLAAGDYIRFGTGVADPVYKVASQTGSGQNIVLDVPYQADDATGVATERITAANANAGNFGIKMTGILQPFVLDSRPVDKVQFNVGIMNSQGAASSTGVSTTQIATYGHGTEALITTQQADSSRNAGDFYGYAIFPYDKPMTTVVTGQNYSTLNIGTKAQRGGLGNLTPNYQVANIMVACALDGNVANTFDTNIAGAPSSVVNVLDSLATSVGFSAQLGNL